MTVTLHRVPMDLSEERLEAFSCKIWTDISNAGIATGDFALQITMTRKIFSWIPPTR